MIRKKGAGSDNQTTAEDRRHQSVDPLSPVTISRKIGGLGRREQEMVVPAD